MPLMTWQIQLSGSLDTTLDVAVYIADVETPPAVIDDLHAARRIVICYFSGGTVEPFRDDASRFPAAALGAPLAAYPDERWVDVRDATVRSIMADRIAAAAAAGCDGLDARRARRVRVRQRARVFARGSARLRSLAGERRARAWAVDRVRRERCEPVAGSPRRLRLGDRVQLRRHRLPVGAPFVAARKAAFLIEYGDESRAAAVCPKALSLGLSAILKRDANLDAFRIGCP
jgi:hypothetical protein